MIESLLPRGLIIMAKNTAHLHRGFPYPKLLFDCGITKAQWKNICRSLVDSLDKGLGLFNTARENRGIAYEVEKILDIAAKLDQQYFRPKGIIMRLDSRYIVFLLSMQILRRSYLFRVRKIDFWAFHASFLKRFE